MMNTDDRKICENSRSSKKRKDFHDNFTVEDDDLLRQLIQQHGEGHWSLIAGFMPKFSRTQIQKRWIHHLAVNIKKGPWTLDEVNKATIRLIPNSNIT